MMAKMFFFIVLMSFSIYSQAVIRELPQNQPRKIVLLTVPKAGTHLVAKALELMTGRNVEWIAASVLADPVINPNKRLNPHDRTIMMHHLFSSFDFIRHDKSGKYVKIIQIRDPRDLLLSQIGWLANCSWCWYAPRDYNKEFNRLSFDQKLTTTITFPEGNGFYSMRYFLHKALEWIEEPDVLVLRFEDLIGPDGGGTREAQEKAIRDLAAHIGYTLDQYDVDRIALSLFGNTPTFKKGLIGEWKKKYSLEHIDLFKEWLGEELIQLGYEPDYNW